MNQTSTDFLKKILKKYKANHNKNAQISTS